MIARERVRNETRKSGQQRLPALGTLGYLALLLWSIALVVFTPGEWIFVMSAFCLLIAGILFPGAFRNLTRPSWIILLGMLILVSAIRLGDEGRLVSLSLDGAFVGVQMALRSLAMLVMISGFSEVVEISQLAGLLERAGMKGLGFSLGIAVNLLPGLAQSSLAAFHALRMRGGLRAQWRNGIQLYLVTVVSNAIRRAEDTALAAEARAFTPQCQRPLPLKKGWLDGWLAAIAAISTVFLIVL